MKNRLRMELKDKKLESENQLGGFSMCLVLNDDSVLYNSGRGNGEMRSEGLLPFVFLTESSKRLVL